MLNYMNTGVIARRKATKQSISTSSRMIDCFAAPATGRRNDNFIGLAGAGLSEVAEIQQGEYGQGAFGVHVTRVQNGVQFIDQGDLDPVAFFILQDIGDLIDHIPGPGFGGRGVLVKEEFGLV